MLNAEAGCAAFIRVMEHVADQTLSREETKTRAPVAKHQSQAAATTWVRKLFKSRRSARFSKPSMISMRGGEERAIAVFREAGDSFSYPILEISLKNKGNDRIRNAAIEIYAALGGRSLPFLMSLLGADPGMNVKHAAAEALGKIGDPQAAR